MPDREKALELVESIIAHAEDEMTNRSWESDDTGWKNVNRIWEAAQKLKELLKEQEDDYKNILSDYEDLAREHEKLLDKKIPLITNGQELVQCKDCKHLEHMYALDELNGKKCYVCRKHSFTGLREEDWFCADGKRKEGCEAE